MKHVTYRRSMSAKHLVLTLLLSVSQCLISSTLMAQEPKVTSLMSKDLKEFPGKELLMITVEHAPGGSSPIHRHNAQCDGLRTGGLRCDAGEGWKRSYADTRTDLL